MIMKKTLLTLSAAALLFITGCDSDSKSNGNAIDISGKTKQEVFMLHSWELSSWLDSLTLGILLPTLTIFILSTPHHKFK